MKTALSSVLPRYEPVNPAIPENTQLTAPAKAEAGAGEVVTLPSFVVLGPRLPKRADMLTLAGKLDHYLGPKDGLDCGLLNRVTLQWVTGPVTVSLFNAVTNETRARTRHADDQRLRLRAELLDFVSLLKLSGDGDGAKPLKRESDSLFSGNPTSAENSRDRNNDSPGLPF